MPRLSLTTKIKYDGKKNDIEIERTAVKRPL